MNFTIISEQDRKIVLQLKPKAKIALKDYQIWFDSFETNKTEKATNNCKKVFQKIKNFPILAKTPIESQLFLISLQKEVNGIA